MYSHRVNNQLICERNEAIVMGYSTTGLSMEDATDGAFEGEMGRRSLVN